MKCSTCGLKAPRAELTILRFGPRKQPVTVATCVDVHACRGRRINQEIAYWGTPQMFAAALWSGRIRRHAHR